MGNIFIRSSRIWHETGFIMEGHTHNFDHVTYFPRGTWEIYRQCKIVGDDGVQKTDEQGNGLWVETHRRKIAPGGYVLIEADCRHGFILLEGPGEYHCIYSHRDPDTHEVIEHYNGWSDAYC